ncbi:hypothetical protein Q8A73_022899, partial [Channa argus]
AKQLCDHLHRNNLYEEFQSGFRLYLSMEPDENNQLIKLQACLQDIKAWMSHNFLLLNSDKTE